MGFFSWKTQDTRKSICNKYQGSKPTFTVYMTDNQGNRWREDNYDGYGEFGGKDFFELMAEMNGLKDRLEAISLVHANPPVDHIQPNLTERANHRWRDIKQKGCDSQGFFYNEYPSYDNLNKDEVA